MVVVDLLSAASKWHMEILGRAAVVGLAETAPLGPIRIRISEMNANRLTRAAQFCAPTGQQQTSPGQRPGFVVPQLFPSPERAKQGNAAFSVSQSNVEAVRRYIEGQEDHHRKMSFQDELRTLFKRHEVEYDEQYVWD